MAGNARKWIVLVAAVALTGLAPAESKAVYIGDFCWTLIYAGGPDTLRVTLDQVNPGPVTTSTIWDANVRVRFIEVGVSAPVLQIVGAGTITSVPGGVVTGPFDFGFHASGPDATGAPVNCVFHARFELPGLDGEWTGSCEGTDTPWTSAGNAGELRFSGTGAACPNTFGIAP